MFMSRRNKTLLQALLVCVVPVTGNAFIAVPLFKSAKVGLGTWWEEEEQRSLKVTMRGGMKGLRMPEGLSNVVELSVTSCFYGG